MQNQSNAQWPKGSCSSPYGDDISTDVNHSEEAAKAVCRALEREGLGGEGKIFPLKTWVCEPDGRKPMKDEMVEKVAEAVKKALKWYRMQYTSFLEDGSAYNLVDALTPPGQESVKLGIKERELLAESITLDVVAALTPEWSDTVPDAPGWYWWKCDYPDGPHIEPAKIIDLPPLGIVVVTDSIMVTTPYNGKAVKPQMLGGQWSGPITPPKATPGGE